MRFLFFQFSWEPPVDLCLAGPKAPHGIAGCACWLHCLNELPAWWHQEPPSLQACHASCSSPTWGTAWNNPWLSSTQTVTFYHPRVSTKCVCTYSQACDTVTATSKLCEVPLEMQHDPHQYPVCHTCGCHHLASVPAGTSPQFPCCWLHASIQALPLWTLHLARHTWSPSSCPWTPCHLCDVGSVLLTWHPAASSQTQKKSPCAAPVHLPCDRHCRSPPVAANAPAAQQATHPFPSLQLESVSLPRTYEISHITSPIHSSGRWHRLLASTEVRKGRSHVASVDVDAHAGELLKIVSCESVAEAAILEDGFEARPAQLLVLSQSTEAHPPYQTSNQPHVEITWEGINKQTLPILEGFVKNGPQWYPTHCLFSVLVLSYLWHIFAFSLLSLMSLQVACSLYHSCHLDLLAPCCLLWHFISSLVLGSSLLFTSSQRRRSSCTTGHSTSIPWWHLRFSLRTLPPRMLTPSVFIPLIRVLRRRLTRRWLERWLSLISHEVTILHLSRLCLPFRSSRWTSSWHQQSTDRRWPFLSHDRSHTQCPFHAPCCRPSIAAFTNFLRWPMASGFGSSLAVAPVHLSCHRQLLCSATHPSVQTCQLCQVHIAVMTISFDVRLITTFAMVQKRKILPQALCFFKKLDWFKPRRFYTILKIAAVGVVFIPYEKCFCPDPLFQLFETLPDPRRAHILPHMRFRTFFDAVFDTMLTNGLFLSPVFFTGLLQRTFQGEQTLQPPNNRNWNPLNLNPKPRLWGSCWTSLACGQRRWAEKTPSTKFDSCAPLFANALHFGLQITLFILSSIGVRKFVGVSIWRNSILTLDAKNDWRQSAHGSTLKFLSLS